MADPTPDDMIPDGARPKRAPPTLDLSATEIPRAESAAEAHATPADKPPRPPSRVLIPAVSGAIAGALVTAAALLAQWPVGSQDPLPAPAADTTALDEIRGRVAKLEARPASPPAPAPAAPIDLSETTKRLDALDKALAAMREENAGLRTQTAQAVTAANAAQAAPPAGAAPPTDLGPVDARLNQIEAAMRAQADKAAEQSRRPADAALRRSVVALQLDALVRQGEPYAAALAAAKPLATDAASLRPLDAFAATGIPNAAKLSAELLALPQLAPTADTATSGGLIGRMRAGATKLVTIERTDAAPNNDAAMGRATAAARRNDVASAFGELSTLPANDRVAVQPWLDRVAAAEAARAAARQFADQAVAAATKPAP